MSDVSRVGLGLDFHRLEEGEELVIGGERIDHPKGTVAHSDGDVLIHALIDAILGALGEGDIGKHFPDSDPKYKDICSLDLLKKIKRKIDKTNMKVLNADLVLIAEEPKVGPYSKQMEDNISSVLSAEVNVKATTTEGILFGIPANGIGAQAVVLLAES